MRRTISRPNDDVPYYVALRKQINTALLTLGLLMDREIPERRAFMAAQHLERAIRTGRQYRAHKQRIGDITPNLIMLAQAWIIACDFGDLPEFDKKRLQEIRLQAQAMMALDKQHAKDDALRDRAGA